VSKAPKRRSGRLQFLLIACAFLGPLVLATWLYFQGDPLLPEGRTNHGDLLEPILSLVEALPTASIHAQHDRSWLLLYINIDLCDEFCLDALYTMRQSRLMLGKEMDRLKRVFLHGSSPPDTVFLANEHQGLITIKDSSLTDLLNKKRPARLSAGGYFLIDPLGNLVMYFRPDIEPSDMVADIKRLLKLSRIG
jgi:hypothetical protein